SVLEADDYREERVLSLEKESDIVEERNEEEKVEEAAKEKTDESVNKGAEDVNVIEENEEADSSNKVEEGSVFESDRNNGISQFNVTSFSKNVVHESRISRLGHLNSVNVDIYESIGGKSFKAGTTYTHAVYYIKKQAQVGDEIYY